MNIIERHEAAPRHCGQQVADVPKASLILERQFRVTDYVVQDEHNLRLYDTALDMAAINKALVVQEVAVISSQILMGTDYKVI